MKMGDVLLPVYRSDQRSRRFQHLEVRAWGSAADAVSHCSSVSTTSLLPVPVSDPNRDCLEMQGRTGGLQCQSREAGSWALPASLTDLQRRSSCFNSRCPFPPAGYIGHGTVTLSCPMREVWGERSHCQCFSPSPLKGIRGTAWDAICMAGGKVCVSGCGCSGRTVHRVRAQNGRDSCRPGLRDTGGQCWEVCVRCFCHLLGSSYF